MNLKDQNDQLYAKKGSCESCDYVSDDIIQENSESNKDTRRPSRFQAFITEIKQFKWRALIVIIWMTVGYYYSLDVHGSYGTSPEHSIQAYFHDRNKTYTQTMNQALYSAFQYPNIVVSFFSGILVDRFFGIRVMCFTACLFIFLSTLILYIGIKKTNYPVMIFARVLYAAGGCVSVSENYILARWFSDTWGLAIACAITVVTSRLGSSLNYYASPRIAKKYGVTSAALTAVGLAGFSVVISIILIFVDIHGVNKGHVQKQALQYPPKMCLCLKKKKEEKDNNDSLQSENFDEEKQEDKKKYFQFKDYLHLPIQLIFLALFCTFSYAALNSFVAIMRNYMQVVYGIDEVLAGTYTSLYSFTSIAGSPVAAILSDFVGRSAFFLVAFGIIVCSIYITIMSTTQVPPILIPMALSISYSILLPGLWPSIAFLVKRKMVATAYSLVYSVQGILQATVPLILGKILDAGTPKSAPGEPAKLPSKEAFLRCQGVLLGCGGIALIIAIVLIFVDASSKRRVLTVSVERRKQAMIDLQNS